MAREITLQFLTLEEIKEQARIEAGFTEGDNYLMLLGKAAEKKVFNDLQHTYDEIVEGEKDNTFPEPLILAGLMLTSYWYKNRESNPDKPTYDNPQGYFSLITEYRKGTYSHEDNEEE